MEKVQATIESYLVKYGTIDVGIQLLLLLSALILALLFHKIFEKWFIKKNHLNLESRKILSRTDRGMIQGMRTMRRIVFPLATALMLLATSLILESLGLAHNLLSILLPLFVALAIVRLVIYFMRAALPGTKWLTAGEGLIATLIWSGFVLYSFGWLDVVVNSLDAIGFSIGDNKRLSLLGIIKLVLMSAVFLLIALWLSRQLDKRLRQSRVLDISMRVAVGKIFKFSLITIAILTALSSAGIDFTALAVFGGALGVGIGFGLRNIVSNFISGFILLFDRSIKPGDVITIGENFGWVVALHARYVVVKNREGVETLIPNENLVTSEVINWSFSDNKVRIKLPFQISYDDDPEQAMQVIIDAVSNQQRILLDPEPACRIIGFGDFGIELQLRVWITDPQNGMANVRSDLNLEVWKAFKQNNITIPYPRQEIQFLSTPPTQNEL
jgi:small-conductance mechanosensitive channel